MLQSQKMARLLVKGRAAAFHCGKTWLQILGGFGPGTRVDIVFKTEHLCSLFAAMGLTSGATGAYGGGLWAGNHPREGQGSCWVLLLNRCS
jgi:hypothetical protein